MKTIMYVPILALCLVVNVAFADQEVTVKEAQITFSLPDAWDTKAISQNPTPPKMDASDPLRLGWSRAAITDPQGTQVMSGINVKVFAVPSDENLAAASASRMQRRSWPTKSVLTGDKDGLLLPNSLGYLTESSPIQGVIMKLFVIHAINDGKFFEMYLSATVDVFPQVESELRAIIRSLRLEK